MRCAVALVAGVLTFTIAPPVWAQTFEPKANLFELKKPAQKPPQVDWSWRPPANTASTAKPTVVCGMTMVPADPKVDPKMRTTAPESTAAFTMRLVPPTVCKAP